MGPATRVTTYPEGLGLAPGGEHTRRGVTLSRQALLAEHQVANAGWRTLPRPTRIKPRRDKEKYSHAGFEPLARDETQTANDGDGQMSDVDGVRAYTVRLELLDRPGELLRALEPVAEHGGNLLSIFHERGNVTPRGDIPVEVDLEATPQQFEAIVDALHETDVNLIQAGTRRYTEELTVVLVGHLVDTDLSNTLSRITDSTDASVRDFSLTAPEGQGGVSSARLQLATEYGETEAVLETVRETAAEKGLRVIEPLTGGVEQ